MHPRSRALVLLAVLLALAPRLVLADGAWLDGGQPAWNTPAMEIPAAGGPAAPGLAQCQSAVRPPETDEDRAVAARGWQLSGGYQRGWGISVVGGFLNFDGMCRPIPFQYFVFVDGVFAGTLAPQAMYPRLDGALRDTGIAAADRLYAVFDRYAPSDPLCCPSGEQLVRFAVARTPQGPVVNPLPEDIAGPATPSTVETFPVCVGLGGDALSLVFWTADEIAAHEATSGSVLSAHPETGQCHDPAGLPLTPNAAASFTWVCATTYEGAWYGPAWTAGIYLPANAVPPDATTGGCPEPRDTTIPLPSEEELAAATAVYLSQLEAAGDLATLYAWLHPDAREVVPEAVVRGWYAADVLPRGPAPITVTSVDFEEWTWDVTGDTYPRTAVVAFTQPFANGPVVSDVIRLVPDEHGAWRWFFGRDRAFVEEQIARFGD
jgi:hypothetical protein